MTEKSDFIFVNCIKPLKVHEKAKSFISDKLRICIPEFIDFLKEQKKLGEHISTITYENKDGKEVTKEVIYIDIRKARENKDNHYSVLNTWKPDEKKAEKKSNTSDDDLAFFD